MAAHEPVLLAVVIHSTLLQGKQMTTADPRRMKFWLRGNLLVMQRLVSVELAASVRCDSRTSEPTGERQKHKN